VQWAALSRVRQQHNLPLGLDHSAYINSLDSVHMVTLGDEGWVWDGGNGSYAYSCAEGVDFVKKLVISILDYGISRTYSDQ
jgi:endo-1,4-beta-mannosidase